MKVQVWTYTCDCGDGSAYPVFFATEAEARAYRAAYEEMEDQWWGEDCVSRYDLEFDADGVLTNGTQPYDDGAS